VKIILFIALFFTLSCKTFLQYENEDQLAKNIEFEKEVEVKPFEEEKTADFPSGEALSQVLQKKSVVVPLKQKIKEKTLKSITKANQTQVNKVKTKEKIVETIPLKRLPELEDSEGFDEQRRPLLDPFRVGEKITHSVRYFAAEAGTLTLEVLPFSVVNNKKSYHFQIELHTSRLFSAVYSVEDKVDTYLDFNTMVPHVFKTNIRESGKLSQAQGYFDHEKLKSNFWEKKYTQKNGQENIKKSWDLLPFSQNAFSSIFYMRVFKWKIGKEYSFRVSDDEKNVVFKAKAILKEKLKTDAGDFDAIKIKADITSRGALTTSSPLFLWVSDDDRKLLLKIEADIKIGSLVSEIVDIERGDP
jgi:hypothetical protein